MVSPTTNVILIKTVVHPGADRQGRVTSLPLCPSLFSPQFPTPVQSNGAIMGATRVVSHIIDNP